MDNLTHSLIGAVIAECVYQHSPSLRRTSVAPRLRRVFWVVSILGSNLPDLDVLYAAFTQNGRLGYLLHHRGHTHTLLFGLVQGAVIGMFAHGWLKRKVKQLSRWDLRAAWGLALTAPLLHLGMDALNNYGVHPFWPVWNGWVYGDSLFIMEPLLWLALFPVVYFVSIRRSWRWTVETLLVALLTAVWILPITRWYSALTIFAMGALMWWACRKSKPRWRAQFCAAMGVSVVVVFSLVSTYARGRLVKAHSEQNPTAKLHDAVLTPFPANPLCWNVITVETFAEGARYRLRRGVFSPFPFLVAADGCPHMPTTGPTAYLSAVPDLWGPEFAWDGQYQAAVIDLKEYVDLSCAWSAFLRFSRTPFLQEEEGSLWAGDLRYDYGPELGFAELEVPEDSGPCKGWVPPWLRPRRDLF